MMHNQPNMACTLRSICLCGTITVTRRGTRVRVTYRTG